MNYILKILKEQKETEQEGSRRISELIKIHEQRIRQLERQQSKKMINVINLNQKIKAIEKDTYL